MNWIKVRTHLISHPHVVRIASALCLPNVHVFGALVHLWAVADSHADGDLLKNMTPAALDRLTETPGLTAELVNVGWVTIRDNGLQLVNYQEHNGASAKRRALDGKRKKAIRIVSASCPQDVRIESGMYVELEKEKEKEEKKKKKMKEAVEVDLADVVLTFPTDNEPNHWHLTRQQVARWEELLPKLDILAECKKALSWVESNPENRKTARGMPRFLNGWLDRSSNRAPSRPTGTTTAPRPTRPAAPLASSTMDPKLAEEIFGIRPKPNGVQLLPEGPSNG
jgi:hypothetical protein